MSEQGGRYGGRIVAAGVASVAVVAAAGAGFAVGSMASGGGTQPEDVLPSNVVAFADIDLDPPADQKLNAVRLLGRLPAVEDTYGPEPDLRELIVDTIAGGTPLADADVHEWIGDRVGLALVLDDESSRLTPVIALQTSDREAALADLRDLVGPDQVAVSDDYDDYVLVTGADHAVGLVELSAQLSAQDIAAAAETESLGETAAFGRAFDHLDTGFASFYVDGAAIVEAAPRLSEGGSGLDVSDLATVAGQSAGVLRAEPSAIELLAWSTSTLPAESSAASLAPGLPDGTVLAVEGTGGAPLVAQRWRELIEAAEHEGVGGTGVERTLAQIEAQADIRLPDDLQTLAGDDLVLAVDGRSMLTGIPGAGLRSITDPDAGADLARRLQHSLATLTGGFGVVATGTTDGMVVATSQDYADTLVRGEGGLGASTRFGEALPDADNAHFLVWVDLAVVSGPLLLAAPDGAAALTPLDSFGLTVGPDDGGTAVQARLLFAEEDDG